MELTNRDVHHGKGAITNHPTTRLYTVDETSPSSSSASLATPLETPSYGWWAAVLSYGGGAARTITADGDDDPLTSS